MVSPPSCFLEYLHRRTPYPTFQGNNDNRNIVMVPATLSLWNLKQLVEVHACKISSHLHEILICFIGFQADNVVTLTYQHSWLRETELLRLDAALDLPREMQQ